MQQHISLLVVDTNIYCIINYYVFFAIVVLPFSYGAHKLMDVGFLRLILVTLINIVLSAVAIFKLGLNKKEQRLVTGIIMLEIFKKHK
jgi:hypothetical protein